MTFLVDTQALLWFLEDNRKLASKARDEIMNSQNDICVSIASYWEMAIKLSLGKLQLPETLESLMNKTEREAIRTLSIRNNHVLTVEKLAFHHRDPFDRIIIATALSEDMTLISNDERFDDYEVERLWL